MYEFKVDGMSCQHCVQAITKSVTAVDAQARVKVDLATQLVQVASVEDLNILAAEIEEAGYTVRSARHIQEPG